MNSQVSPENAHTWEPTTNTLAVWKCGRCGAVVFSPHRRPIEGCKPKDARIIVLSERTRFGGETGAGSMRNRCSFTSRDMAADWPEAFTYAVVLGWDDEDHPEDGAMDDIAGKFGWDDEMVAFLRDTHERFRALSDRVISPGSPTDAAS